MTNYRYNGIRSNFYSRWWMGRNC